MFPSTNFLRLEFRCKCGCGMDTVDVELLHILEMVRAHYKQPVVILSGCRCIFYNRKVGGKPSSQHLKSRAADIRVGNVAPQQIYNFIDSMWPDEYGVGCYEWGVHVDSRKLKARW